MNTGTLYIVATPIGNLADLSPRAITTLQNVDHIAAEDTRHAQTLLKHHQIQTPCISLHAHNEQARSQQLLEKLQQGTSIALISDAGTPLISDPGSRLVNLAHEQQIPVCPIPGPCAAITALCASGLDASEFRFVGFLAAKGERREQQIQKLIQDPATIILYESVHRIKNLMTSLKAALEPERIVCLARELTKRFEQIKRAPISELYEWFSDHPEQQKGEYVVLIAGAIKPTADQEQSSKILARLLQDLPTKRAVALCADLTGCKRNQLYELALTLQQQKPDP